MADQLWLMKCIREEEGLNKPCPSMEYNGMVLIGGWGVVGKTAADAVVVCAVYVQRC